jgi:hypothetical protein
LPIEAEKEKAQVPLKSGGGLKELDRQGLFRD